MHERDQRGSARLDLGDAAPGGTISPISASTRGTRAPARSAIVEIRSPKTPFTATSAVSPGSSRFTRHASMPALPVPESGNAKAVRSSRDARSRRCISSSSARNAGSRWPIERSGERGAHLVGDVARVRDRAGGAREARQRAHRAEYTGARSKPRSACRPTVSSARSPRGSCRRRSRSRASACSRSRTSRRRRPRTWS